MPWGAIENAALNSLRRRQPESGGYIESMTGGVSNTIEGHPVAYIGGTALCNACESGGVIAKAGGPSRRKHYGAEIALDDDILLCQCPKPPRMAAIVQSVSRHDDRAETLGTVTSNKTIDGRISSVVTGGFDEQVVTRQARRVDGYAYLIETEDGRVFSGQTDSGHRLPRVHTNGSGNFTAYWGDDALSRQDGI
jgi:hypothetical protein